MKLPDPSGRPRSFGRVLREQRKLQNLGLRRLASMSGLSASYLSQIEHDHLPAPSAKFMNRLARALNTEVETLRVAAGRVPEWAMAVLRERPRALQALLTLIAPMTDDELDDLCDEVRRRLAMMPPARLEPRLMIYGAAPDNC